ncbi:MAG: type II toxin-antitoxin system VapC family toxin [Solirubrobacteraceae bacterium]
MTDVLCDTSIVVKWFHESGETEVAQARAILEAHTDRTLTAVVLDLTVYELGNVAARALGLPGDRVVAILDRLELICDEGLRLSPRARRDAAELAAAHRLSFYDAAYWAVARERGITLVTADAELLRVGAGLTPTAFAAAGGIV